MHGAGPARALRDDVRILSAVPETFDPAAQGDIGSASVTAQIFESLTAVDRNLAVQPALAASWDVSGDGTRIVFHLRDGLTFSDGSDLTAVDVVESWLRLIDPARPSPLSSLLLAVAGAGEYLAGHVARAAVGLEAQGRDVVVTLARPSSDFPAIVAGPTFAVVPAIARRDPAAFAQPGLPVSGGYTVANVNATEITLTANGRYWAGRPAIGTVHLISDIGGRSPVTAFEDGTLDYTSVSWSDAGWLAYDPALGPSLRAIPQLTLTYLGFDTSRPPFDDARVRRAFGAAVDWTRLVELAGGNLVPADGMVPVGTPGRPGGSFLPAFDPAGDRRLLAEAGFPGGAGFPTVTFSAGGLGFAPAIVADLARVLNVKIEAEARADHYARLETDPPPMWVLGWVADYPGANDFLGVLLGTGSSNDYARWSSSEFDGAIADALASRDAATATAAYARALGVVRDEVPAIPLAYGSAWALSRSGLLGARENGLGLLRIAGMAWGAGG